MAEKPGRTVCAVPFCRRTCRESARYAEYLCAVHWPLTDRRLRRLFFRVRHRINRGRPGLIGLENRIWERLKEQAILRV